MRVNLGRSIWRVRDYAQMNNHDTVGPETAKTTLKMLEIDEKGLEDTDRKILSTIAETFDGGPVGLKAVAAAISEEENTIEDVYEPYLIRVGFIARTSQGRIITQQGLKHLGLKKSLLDF